MNEPTEQTSPDDLAFPDARREGWYGWWWAIFLLGAMAAGYYLMAWQRQFDPSRHAWVGQRIELGSLVAWNDSQRPIDGRALRGKVLLVNFWGTWCPPCRIEWPHLVALAESYRSDDRFQLISVACAAGGQSESDVAFRRDLAEFLDGKEIPFDIFVDRTAVVRRRLASDTNGRFGYPTTLLIDEDGVVRAVWEGYQPGTETEMKTSIDRLIGSKRTSARRRPKQVGEGLPRSIDARRVHVVTARLSHYDPYQSNVVKLPALRAKPARGEIMLVVMQRQADNEMVSAVVAKIEQLGLSAHPMPGATRTAIGITGNTAALDPSTLSGLPGVLELIRVTKPFKLASREMHIDDSVVTVGSAQFGPGKFTIIAGPCSVENETMLLETARFLKSQGVHLLRGGAFKPRTSPYSFQGLGEEGLRILRDVGREVGIGIVTEVMDASQVDIVEASADMLQIGARNMQNFTLLKRVSQASKPVLLKRGIAATLEEWLMAAEYMLAGGNRQVVLCERGVRTFADHSRNTLDLSVIPPVKELSHLPIIIDPSHGTGCRKYVPAMARAALAAGADGLMIEVHPRPEQALSDGAQSLHFDEFADLHESLAKMAQVTDRTVA